MDVYTSDSSDTDSREQKTLDYGRMELKEITFEEHLYDAESKKTQRIQSEKDIETILLNHNRLRILPQAIKNFVNLKVLDLSSNRLTELPDALAALPLVTLIAKNNQLTNESLPKIFTAKNSTYLKELNLSGNLLTHFPEQCFELKYLKYLYLGGNRITSIAKEIYKMQSLNVLSLGGNLISEVPAEVGLLSQLQALILCDNLIEHLPTSIARLKNLKSLSIHKNRLKHLPKDIVALKNLTELSLRDNPLVVRFVQDIALNPPSLMELAARVIKTNGVPYGPQDLPRTTFDYLSCANCCVNPNCKGVFFDNRVEHIKFVDFCGKYRVPLLQYLCSSKCIEPEQPRPHTSRSGAASGYMMRKVLLG